MYLCVSRNKIQSKSQICEPSAAWFPRPPPGGRGNQIKSPSEFPGPRTGDEGTIELSPPGASPEGMSN